MARGISAERKKAKELYDMSFGTLSAYEIALKVDRSPELVRTWKHQDDWDGLRTHKTSAPIADNQVSFYDIPPRVRNDVERRKKLKLAGNANALKHGAFRKIKRVSDEETNIFETEFEGLVSNPAMKLAKEIAAYDLDIERVQLRIDETVLLLEDLDTQDSRYAEAYDTTMNAISRLSDELRRWKSDRVAALDKYIKLKQTEEGKSETLGSLKIEIGGANAEYAKGRDGSADIQNTARNEA
ncbi:MAG: hypothetical protein LBT88_06640 [Oscillospiraceae bacterium]|jgi:hypothetical protein|nr:hypothetical protein [Oscillospiraceae bacterium]